MKGLLAGMPPVTKRVEEMRAGRAPGPSSKQAQVEVDQSQVRAFTRAGTPEKKGSPHPGCFTYFCVYLASGNVVSVI